MDGKGKEKRERELMGLLKRRVRPNVKGWGRRGKGGKSHVNCDGYAQKKWRRGEDCCSGGT